jgi:aspartate/methionine/tyrosine aminotransferase
MTSMSVAKRISGLAAPVEPTASTERIPEGILSAIEAALRAGDTHYTPRPGLIELRTAVAARIARCGGPTLDPATDIVITAGEEEAMFVTIFALGLPGTTCAVRTRQPRRHAGLFAALNVTTRGSGATSAYRDIDQIAERPASDAAEIVDASDRVAEGGPWPPLDLGPRTLIIGSLDALPGIGTFRVGFVLGLGSVMDKVRSWKQALSICTAGPSQRAALFALEQGERR